MAVSSSNSSDTASVTSESVHSDTKRPIKRLREGKPKVKTGCVTCKIRRIKCDEEKPNCKKCTSTGRQCDGYARLQSATVTLGSDLVPATHSLSNPFLNFQGTRLEHRYLDFFVGRTASALSGPFECSFWHGLLPQVSHSEPTIRHAMIAVASLHERFEISGDLMFDPATGCGTFALQQYNKAISCLTKRLNEGPQSEEVTLMCCALFISLEYLRGNVTSAINHLNSGIEILITWRGNDGYAMDEAIGARSHPNSISANIMEIFTRISVQSMLCGHRSTTKIPKVTEFEAVDTSVVIPTFRSVYDARKIMDSLMKVTIRFLCLTAPFKYLPDSPERQALERPRMQFQALVKRWDRTFRNLFEDPSVEHTNQELRSSRILRMQAIVGEIWLTTCLCRDEMVFDTLPGLEGLFREAIALASALNCDTKTSDTRSKDQTLFSFDMGIIATLYFIALKCRIPSVRRAALGILATVMPRREGIWDATIAATVAARVIEIEEEDLENVGLPHPTDPDGEKLPPMCQRVLEVIINRQDDVAWSGSEKQQKVTFIMNPNGLTSHWHMRKEMLYWTREEQGWKPRHTVLESKWTEREMPPHSSALGHLVPGFFP